MPARNHYPRRIRRARTEDFGEGDARRETTEVFTDQLDDQHGHREREHFFDKADDGKFGGLRKHTKW